MTQRRDFLKTAAMGTVALSPIAGLANLAPSAPALSENTAGSGNITNGSESRFEEWKTAYNEETSILTLRNKSVFIQGKLGFVSGDNAWKVCRSRDGVPNRYTLVDTQDNVQGYWVLNSSGKQLDLLFYHRTAQGYSGEFSFEGTISFLPDAFTCRTRPEAGEKVLCLTNGVTDSLLNDSFFSPQQDALLQLNASSLTVNTTGEGQFSFRMAGRIEEASEAVFAFNLEENYFKNRYVPYYHPIDRKRCSKAPTGWMSWNTYFDKATAEDNLNEAKIGKKYLQPFGCEFWSIESWQGNSDQLPVSGFYNMNLEVNEKQFPKGMKKLADDIRALGFRPGLWTAPFGTGSVDFYNAHKSWFLHNKEGKPISSWNGKYTLDPTVKAARDHIREIHRIASREWGFEFFKIDGMSGRGHGYCAHLYERPEIKACFSDPSCPNPFELCVKAFREGIGEDRVFLACQGHTSGPEALYADASRIGADIVHPNQPVKWSGVLNQARCLINQVFTHNIVMVADPDTLLVRELPLEEARTSATIVALPGQLTFFGDKLSGVDDTKMKILQQTLPVADVRPGNLYPYFRMLPVWNLRVQNKLLGEYNVVAFFNWEDTPETVRVTTRELGIPDKAYTGVEFWTGEGYSYKTEEKELTVNVPAHGVRLVTLHTIKDIPQWIGSDRHIAQTAMEFSDYRWIPGTHSLEGKIQLIDTFPLTLHIRVPQGYAYTGIDCKGIKHSVKQNKDILSITLQAKKTIETAFSIKFRV